MDRRGASPRPSFTLATYNMLRGGGRRATLREVLDDTGADALLAQEAPLTELGSFRAAWGQAIGGRAWGSCIVVRTGTLAPVPLSTFEGWLSAGLWRRRKAADLLLVSLHVPAHTAGYVRSVNLVLDALAAWRGTELVIAGDFNVCVSARHHSGGGTPHGQLAVQARLQDEFGLVGCWDALHPRARPPQTLRWVGNRATPYHCDGIFVPARWRAALRHCVVPRGVRWERRSDHFPVVARLGRP